MNTARIVVQLDYSLDGPVSDAGPAVVELHHLLLDFADSHPGMSVVLVGFAEIDPSLVFPTDAPTEH